MLTQLDGVVNDIKQTGLFSDSTNLEIWDSISGHSSGLKKIVDIFKTNRTKTSTTLIELPYRNGILHGRELNYNSRLLAIKTLTLLVYIDDWYKVSRNEEQRKKLFEEEQIRKSGRIFQDFFTEYDNHKNKMKQFDKLQSDWKPRCSEEIDLMKLKEGTPEYVANKFFEYIKDKNFGKPVEFYAKNFFRDVSAKVKAGKFRKDFSEFEIQDFTVSIVNDTGSAASEVEMFVQYGVDGEVKDTSVIFRMVYEIGDQIENRLMIGGNWKIVNIEALVNFFRIDIMNRGVTMSDFNVDDIYVLYNMLNKPVLKENVKKLVTKGSFFLRLNTKEIDIQSSVSRLLKAGLIRENTPKEFLPYLTVSDLKHILNRTDKITKDSLILEAKSTVSDEKIKKHHKYMTFYIVSDLGNEILEKYKNLILFFNKSHIIFQFGEINGRFNAPYFFKNYTHNPLEEIFNYYQNKDPEIAGRVCYIKEEYDTCISYAIKSITNMVVVCIDKLVERAYYFNGIDFRRTFFDRWIVDSYTRMEMKEDVFKELIKNNYYKYFKYKDILSYELFERIQLAIMINESEELVRVSSEVNNLILENYSSENDKMGSNEDDHTDIISDIEVYYEKTAKELALLDLLIDHLDLELLYGLRDRVDIKIQELEDTY